MEKETLLQDLKRYITSSLINVLNDFAVFLLFDILLLMSSYMHYHAPPKRLQKITLYVSWI